MARGGYRPGSGRPKQVPADVQQAALEAGQSPLDYMLSVMRDPRADRLRRDRMAIGAAAFVHPKGGAGKKEEAAASAGRVGKGRLATPRTPPRLIVNNKP